MEAVNAKTEWITRLDWYFLKNDWKYKKSLIADIGIKDYSVAGWQLMALRYDVKIDYMHCELKLRLKYVLMIPLSFSDSPF